MLFDREGRGFENRSAQILALGDGLSESEAQLRLERDGPNLLPSGESRRWLQIIRSALSEPMSYLLFACGLVYFVLGDPSEAILLLGFLILILAITVIQEGKAERTLESLRARSSPLSLVVRGGEIKRISSDSLVQGDLVVVNPGDRVSADGAIKFAADLAIDESLLTGESAPVDKSAVLTGDLCTDREMAFAGTLVVRGRGVFEIQKTGIQTRLGKIGLAIQNVRRERTGLEKQTRKLVVSTAFGGVLLCLVILIVIGMVRDRWLEGLLYGLTLAMAILPNEIPAVLVIYLSLGAWRLARFQVLTRHAGSIEALGSTTVLCVDKTGTVTMNRMRLRRLVVNNLSFDLGAENRAVDGCTARGSTTGGSTTAGTTTDDRAIGDRAIDEHSIGGQKSQTIPEDFHCLLEHAILASESESLDPMDLAFVRDGSSLLSGTEHLHPTWRAVHSFPVTERILAVSRVWETSGQPVFLIAAKGAPESIVELCGLSQTEADQIHKQVHEMAQQGLRVLGVAKAQRDENPIESHPLDYRFEFLGLVGLGDPVRAEVPDAVRKLQNAGVRVCLMTGDHAATASAVAREIGLENPERVLSGVQIEKMDLSDFKKAVVSTSVYCRVSPMAKLSLVNAFKSLGEVVAMTGDGVNDAPALKSAQVGIAMGAKGTDVAREAASLVLLNDDFGSIVSAMQTGRRIYRNLRQSMSYLLAVHVPIAGLSVLPVIFDLPMILFPVHVAFLHLVIEPACATVFENVGQEENLMRVPPRSVGESLIDAGAIWMILWQGLGILGLLFAVYLFSLRIGQSSEEARTLVFVALVLCSVGSIFAFSYGVYGSLWRALKENKALRRIVILVGPAIAAVLSVPALRRAFGFSGLHWIDLAMCLVSAVISALLLPRLFSYRLHGTPYPTSAGDR